jgi:ABC-type transporter Mla MlaB component
MTPLHRSAVAFSCAADPAEPPAARLRLRGELDYDSAEELIGAVDRLLGAGEPGGAMGESVGGIGRVAELRLDCAELTGCDSSGLAALLQVHRATTAYGARLRLEHRPAALERLLTVTGTHDHLTGGAADSGGASDIGGSDRRPTT